MQLQSLTIERFKKFERVDFDLSDVNIFVGGNNSGKSTLIQAIHFTFTLLQSLEISKKWPAASKKSTTVSPSELIYVPSEDPYSLGYGGKLLEDEDKAIVIRMTFDSGETITLSVRKGRITNLLVEPDNVEFARTISKLDAPFSVYSPGLAGVARTEQLVSDGVLLRALARGDANSFLRNILYRLRKGTDWKEFEGDLAAIFPGVAITVKFDDTIDQYIDVRIHDGARAIPFDLAGTGLLQSVQILAYFHLFHPKLIILDEPDSHLHPNNQRLLCSLLLDVAKDRAVQVLLTTHSRHVLDSLRNGANILWVQNSKVSAASDDDQLDILLELGALDIRERLSSGNYKVVVLTEDANTTYLTKVVESSGFDMSRTVIMPYNGVTSVHLLKPLIKQIKDFLGAAIIVHRDRDFMEPDEVNGWQQDIRSAGADPFVTAGTDIESYFTSDAMLKASGKQIEHFDIAALRKEAVNGLDEEILSNFVNGRIDIERKKGNIAKVDHGKLAGTGAKKVAANAWDLLKGKRRLSRIRDAFNTLHGQKFVLPSDAQLIVDKELQALSVKHFKKTPE